MPVTSTRAVVRFVGTNVLAVEVRQVKIALVIGVLTPIVPFFNLAIYPLTESIPARALAFVG